MTVVSGGLPIELTTMRRDGAYRDNRHPDSVTFGTSIEEDLARRDFTVNAIALSPDGTLVDPYGGQEDLKAGVLRCVFRRRRRPPAPRMRHAAYSPTLRMSACMRR